jgi:hypothetical protein
MVVVDRARDIMSFEFRGKLGKPTGIGAMKIGWNELGDEQNLVGYFQKRRGGIWDKRLENARIGFFELGANELGSDIYWYKMAHRSPQKIVLLKHYYPKQYALNSICGTLLLGQNGLGLDYENQKSWRAIFADGVQAWKDLTTGERLYYNSLRYPTGQSGFTRFMSKYMSDHRE